MKMELWEPLSEGRVGKQREITVTGRKEHSQPKVRRYYIRVSITTITQI